MSDMTPTPVQDILQGHRTPSWGPDLIGRQLGPYTVVSHLASGGMSELYAARQQGLGGFEKTLVIKMLQDRHARHPRVVKMFLNEARLVAKLSHSSIVDIYDVAEEDGNKYIAMEYIHGETLTSIMKRGVEVGAFLPLEYALQIISQVADGLDYAHSRDKATRIVHCDVSPSNIMVSYEGQTKVIDFGIARVEAHLREEWGMHPGKASYMSPEQVLGTYVDHRSDIFSLGIILYEITLAHRLWRGPAEEVKRRIVSETIPRPSAIQRDYLPALEQIVMRALEKRPDDRYQSAEEMRQDLEEVAAAVGFRSGAHRLSMYLRELFPLRASRSSGGVVQPRLPGDADSAPLPSVVGSVPADENGWEKVAALSTATHRPAEAEAQPPDEVLTGVETPRRTSPSRPKLVLSAAVVTFCSLIVVVMLWRSRNAHRSPLALPGQAEGAESIRNTAPPAAISHPVDDPAPPVPMVALAPLPLAPAAPRPAPVARPPSHTAPSPSEPARYRRPPSHVALAAHPAPPGLTNSGAEYPVFLPETSPVPEAKKPAGPAEPAKARSAARPLALVSRSALAGPASSLASAPSALPVRPPGFVDGVAVTAVVRRHAAEVQECFDRALMERPELRGRFAVRATIDPNGRVLAVSPTSVLDGGGRLGTCVVAAFERWTFPQPAGGVNGNITYSFSFE